MTVSKTLEITCNNCHETERFSWHPRTKPKQILKDCGYTSKHYGWWEGTSHWCSDCNDREKETFYVIDGRGEEYLGEIKAWSKTDARKVAWDTFDQENMVRRSEVDAMEYIKS